MPGKPQPGRRKPLPPELEPQPWAIVSTYLAADDDTLRDGRSWYARANVLAHEIGVGDVAVGAGILAALSPQVDWDRNVELARRAVADGKASGALGTSCRKADAIMYGWGDPLDILGGPKVRAFYGAILDPERSTDVVIDRHAFDIAVGRVTEPTERDRALGRVGVYERFADAYREAARILSGMFGQAITPATAQATAWLVWRQAKVVASQ